MSLLRQAPRFDVTSAVDLARKLYALEVSASPLPSERDQNFLLVTSSGSRFVMKIANATEDQALLEAQNAAMAHLASRVDFSPHVLPTIDGEAVGVAPNTAHLVRLVTYLAGVPMAEATERRPALFESLGGAVGRLAHALADFDHPAIHRDFHWDLMNAAGVIREYLPLVQDAAWRRTVQHMAAAALLEVESRAPGLRCSAIHNDVNDWNVLIESPNSRFSTPRVVGIIDFGDMVHSWTVADLAVTVAYAVLDAADPVATAAAVVRGYQAEHPLREEELAAVNPLAVLRLCVSACIAAWQQEQRPDDAYLMVSQGPIRRTLPALAPMLSRP